MIEEGSGNLLAADVDALVNTVNTVGVMGKGVALQFKRAYPENFGAYRAACERGAVRLGEMFVYDASSLDRRLYIVNFPTKQHWRNPSRLSDIEAGLDDLVRVVVEREIASIAIPALGCGNGGLDWAEVRPLIVRACDRLPEVRALVFPPARPPQPNAMPNNTVRPPLTTLRALLLTTIARYLDQARTQEVRDGVSELEIQKLAYFLQGLGAPLRLVFSRGRYGPYAGELARVLELLEGHYLVGLGDRTSRVTELVPVNLTSGSLEAATAVLADDPGSSVPMDSVLGLVDGFETPYSLELLATVHFAAHQQPATADPATLHGRVATWNVRKARLFTEEHVATATWQLAEHNLLPS